MIFFFLLGIVDTAISLSSSVLDEHLLDVGPRADAIIFDFRISENTLCLSNLPRFPWKSNSSSRYLLTSSLIQSS
ncbi:unnamed protein product [Pneumocystis jirovecii]|uniref:Secreted protein n=1 Tax=Pneumocystis jirovecii TaxID=42068 RepID=L0PEH6_PNEJI|nr:unnamed protein product [Pneumocystis jirovecii]